jgi:dimethylamine--corrinoid protein Co-methyltransferase
MDSDEIREDIVKGTEDASDRGRIPALSQEDIDRLQEICSLPWRFVGVQRGNEVVLSSDGGILSLGCNEEPSSGIPVGRSLMVQVWERVICADTAELGHIDYSYKSVKPVVHSEQREMEEILLSTVLPVFYGAMPNLGLYTQPDGPVPNPSELMPRGRISEAKECQEQAVELAVKDMVYVAGLLHEAGADGIDFDTAGAAGDADFLATLMAVETLKREYPDISIMVGMSGETVIGMHGDLYYGGVRLAGLKPHQQMEMVEKAGGTIFGPAINTNTSRSLAWNISRAVTYTKACVDRATIPVHTNVGMGVGGVPMFEVPSPDAVCRVSTALAEVARLDGL